MLSLRAFRAWIPGLFSWLISSLLGHLSARRVGLRPGAGTDQTGSAFSSLALAPDRTTFVKTKSDQCPSLSEPPQEPYRLPEGSSIYPASVLPGTNTGEITVLGLSTAWDYFLWTTRVSSEDRLNTENNGMSSEHL